jgi:hypothetical protein
VYPLSAIIESTFRRVGGGSQRKTAEDRAILLEVKAFFNFSNWSDSDGLESITVIVCIAVNAFTASLQAF